MTTDVAPAARAALARVPFQTENGYIWCEWPAWDGSGHRGGCELRWRGFETAKWPDQIWPADRPLRRSRNRENDLGTREPPEVVLIISPLVVRRHSNDDGAHPAILPSIGFDRCSHRPRRRDL